MTVALVQNILAEVILGICMSYSIVKGCFSKMNFLTLFGKHLSKFKPSQKCHSFMRGKRENSFFVLFFYEYQLHLSSRQLLSFCLGKTCIFCICPSNIFVEVITFKWNMFSVNCFHVNNLI